MTPIQIISIAYVHDSVTCHGRADVLALPVIISPQCVTSSMSTAQQTGFDETKTFSSPRRDCSTFLVPK